MASINYNIDNAFAPAHVSASLFTSWGFVKRYAAVPKFQPAIGDPALRRSAEAHPEQSSALNQGIDVQMVLKPASRANPVTIRQ